MLIVRTIVALLTNTVNPVHKATSQKRSSCKIVNKSLGLRTLRRFTRTNHSQNITLRERPVLWLSLDWPKLTGLTVNEIYVIISVY